MKYLFLIYSCKKNSIKSEKLYSYFLNNLHVDKILIVNGLSDGDYDNEIEEEIISKEYKILNNKLILNVQDGYEYLNLKTNKLFQIINTIYSDYDGVFKCDDDIIPNIPHLNYFIDNLSKNNIDYCGNIVNSNQHFSSYHMSKPINNNFKKPMLVPTCAYCQGPLYFLSIKSIKIFNKENSNIDETLFFEDVFVGYNLNKHSIYPSIFELFSDNIQDKHKISYHNRYHSNIEF